MKDKNSTAHVEEFRSITFQVDVRKEMFPKLPPAIIADFPINLQVIFFSFCNLWLPIRKHKIT
jgi:hypothetical protein